jgi:hypothetical protein
MHSSIEKYYGGKDSVYYALYYSAMDSFLLVETKNIFVAEQIATVLSSKVALGVIILPLDEKNPIMNNNTVEQFGLTNQQYMPTLSIVMRKDTPIVTFLHHSKLIKRKQTYNEDTKKAIEDIKSYAIFCQKILHAINLSYLLHKHYFIELEQQEYERLFLKKTNKKILNPVEETMNILYFANDEAEALDNISALRKKYIDYSNSKALHQNYIRRDIARFLELFYSLSNLTEPNESKT